MTSTDVKRLAKQKIDALSPIGAKVALEFLSYLDAKEDSAATEELLAMPGLLADFREAERQVAAGKVVPLEELQRRRKARVSRRPV